MTVTENYHAASKTLIARTDALADVGTPLPKTGIGHKPFPYTRDLLDWVLSHDGLADTDLASQCFDALCLLSIAYAVPEADAWMRAKWAWDHECREVQQQDLII